MEIKELEVKVAKAAEKVTAIKGTIQRHEKGVEKKLAVVAKFGITLDNMEEMKWLGGVAGTGGSDHYWEICQVEQKQDDIKGATRKLKEAELILENWKGKLSVEVEKERFLNEQAPAIIVEFLNQWKEMARGWYIKAHTRYVELRTQLTEAKKDAEGRFLAENPDKRAWGREYDKFMKSDIAVKNIVASVAMLGGAVATMATYRQEDERLKWLEKMLEADRKAKLLDLIYRINEVVGKITDAALLRVSEKGNLDGIIIGEQGRAKIETIGAGGYAIQIFHYRTLVHKLNT
jgi:hypothetical protein